MKKWLRKYLGIQELSDKLVMLEKYVKPVQTFADLEPLVDDEVEVVVTNQAGYHNTKLDGFKDILNNSTVSSYDGLARVTYPDIEKPIKKGYE